MRRAIALFRQKVSIISIPMNLGQPSLGLDKAPTKIIDGGLKDILGGIGWGMHQAPPLFLDSIDVSGCGELAAGLKAKNCAQVGRGCKVIRDHTLEHCKPGTFPLILGGDHCISIGTLSAIRQAHKDTGVVWVDAHADINNPSRSVSGNMHGMPVSFLMGLVDHPKKLPGFEWFKPCLGVKDLVYIGLRDLDQDEKDTIRRLGIKAFTMYDVDRLGVGKVMEETLAYFNDKKDIHLSFDIDAIDPFYAPHTGTAVTGGLTFREGNYICEALHESGKLASMELVEVDPSQHAGVEHSRTIDCALTLIGSAMGKRIL